jgi:uncharacterized protein (TIGR02246 family)
MRTLAEDLIAEWTGCWNSYDLDVVDELFLSDGRLTYFSSEKEGVIRGREAIVAHHEGFGFVPGGTEQENRLWLDEVAYDLFDSAVVVTAIWYFARTGEHTPPQKGPVTFVLTWEGDRLWIAHCNFSNYLDPPEGKEG